MATNTSDFYTYSKTAGTAKNLQKPTVAGDTNVWGTSLNTDLDSIVAAVNAMSDLIADASQNELIDFTATGSAVNHIGITNAATGNAPSIAAIGDNTNINLTLAPKGSGEVDISKVDIDSGAIDGTAIGASSHSTGKFTTCDATTDFTIGGTVITDNTITDDGTLVIAATTATSFSDGNIIHVGDINLDSVSVDDAAVGLDIIFGGNTTLNKISLTDNLADALNINQGGTSYLQFVTTNSGEKIVAGKDFETSTTKKVYSKGNCYQTSFHASLFFGY